MKLVNVSYDERGILKGINDSRTEFWKEVMTTRAYRIFRGCEVMCKL